MWKLVLLLALGALGAGCQPKVQIEAPKEPITVNVNVKIEHDVRVRVDKDLDDLFKDEKDIF